MRNFVTKLALMLAVMVVPTVAQAQYTANFTKGTVNDTTNASYNGVYVGPYKGTLTGGTLPSQIALEAQTNKFWCLDFNGSFSNGPVVIRSFSQIIATNAAVTTQLTNIAKALTYADLQPNNSQDAEIHEFVWNQFGSTPTWGLTTPIGIASTNVNLNEFFLVEFDGTADGQFKLGGVQELAFRSTFGGNLSTVPEPSTYMLMASGLAGLAYIRRRKTAKVKA